MGKFKTKDSVRVIGYDFVGDKVFIGGTGIVEGEIETGSGFDVSVRMNKRHGYYIRSWFPESSLVHERQYILNAIKRYEAIQ